MLTPARARLPSLFIRQRLPIITARTHTTTENPVPTNDPNPKKDPSPTSNTNSIATSSTGSFDKVLKEQPDVAEKLRVMQSPNRADVWSRSQRPRELAQAGPRFEQTIMEDQPRPYAAIDLIHKQPVRWVKERVVSCDGGGGPLGHPRIFINVDKPQICWCTYCGLPFAHQHNRKKIEALSHKAFPLDPQGDPAEVGESQRVSNEPYGQR